MHLSRRHAGLALLSAGLAQADPPLQVVSAHLPPYAIEGGAERGALVELVEQLFQLAGWPLQVRLLPWARAVHVASHEPRVALLPLSRTPDREADFQWLLPLIPRRFGFVSRADGPQVRQLADALPLRIGVVRASPSDNELLRRGLANERLVRATGVEDLLRMLSLGMIDVVYGNPVMFHEQRRRSGQGPVLQDGLMLDGGLMWLAARSGVRADEQERLQALLQRLRREGAVARLFRRYQLAEDGSSLS